METPATKEILKLMLELKASVDSLRTEVEDLKESMGQTPIHACNGGTVIRPKDGIDWHRVLERLEESMSNSPKNTRTAYLPRATRFLEFCNYEPDEEKLRQFILKLSPYTKWFHKTTGRKHPPRKKGSTYRQDANALKKLFDEVEDIDLAGHLRSYVDRLVRKNAPKGDKRKHPILMDKEIIDFFKTARNLYENPNGGTRLNHGHYICLKTQLWTGVRISALLQLTPSMFKYLGDHPYLVLPRRLVKRQEHGAEIPIVEELYEEIHTYAEDRGIAPDDRLFPYDEGTYNSKIRMIAAGMKLNRKFTSHGMRGTAISQAYLRFGKDSKLAQKFAAHKNFETTAYYMDLHPDSTPIDWWNGMNL